MNDFINYSVNDHVATITIDRPKARNSLDLDALNGLIAAVRAADSDEDIGAIILTGTGEVFSAGLDLTSLSTGEIDVFEHTSRGNPWLERCKPMIAAVNGPAITGGLELVLNCDFAIASLGARFADTHTRVGILPFWGMSTLLPRAIGPRNASLMSLTGNFISAEEAYDWGLVSEVVAPDELLARTQKLAADIVGNDQPGVRAMLKLYRDGAGLPNADAAGLEIERAMDWHGDGFDAAGIAKRFEAIKARGRAQSS